MLLADNRAKRLLVQAPMAIPERRAHGHFRLRPARARVGRDRRQLNLPVQISFCIRPGFASFSSKGALRRTLQIAFIWTLSHLLQFAPRRANGLTTFWPTLNHCCHPQMDAVFPTRCPGLPTSFFWIVSLAALLIRCRGVVRETVET
jgi:hypothetical protein